MAETRTAAAPILHAAARTDPGRVRSNNEDVPVIDAARGVFGVIDGIGGHAGGEVAAAMAREIILQRLARPLGAPAERVREAIALANNEIFRCAADRPELGGMACVMTLAIVADGRLTIGHVGDTRLYKLGPDGIHKLTRDHSPVGEREDAGLLSEADAMRHPHRNEVFRDVGTVLRDKDEQEFVDLIDEPIAGDEAILLCSDGLSDMLPASTIAHTVRQHAGNPEQVVDALVAAANEAGGRDNITVVYAEMPQFAEAMAPTADKNLTPTEPGGGQPDLQAQHLADRDASPRPGRLGRWARAVVARRTLWFFVGALAGVVGALLLAGYVETTQLRGSRTLIVAPDGTSAFTGIAAALAAARPGDVVRVEPGVYREEVAIRDGVDLVARVPGTVTIMRPASATGPPLAISGALEVRVSGIKIDSEAPADIGVQIAAPSATLDLMEIAGPVRHALALSAASSVTVRGSRIAVTETVLAVPDDGSATFANCILSRSGASAGTALSLGPSSHLVLRGNVFAGFGSEIIAGTAQPRRLELLAGNVVVPADPPGSSPLPEKAGPGSGGGKSRPTGGRGSAASGPRAPKGVR